jgi:hypothetical protein
MKIIFQDVDGPLISARMYYKNLARDQKTGRFVWDAVAVGMLNHICEQHGAKIVFNSAHNAEGPEYLIRHCEFNGLNVEHIHPTIHTEYPLDTLRRLDAISKWLTLHGEGVDGWVVVDDYKIPTENLVQVDFNLGITIDNYADIVQRLGGPGIPIY